MLKLSPELKKYSTDEARHIVSLNIVYLFAGFIHFLFFLIFFYYRIWELYIFNIISPFIYILCYLINRKNRIVAAAVIAISEATVHGTLAVFLIGWQSGFHYYILLVFILIYFLIKINLSWKIIMSVPVFLTYIGLYMYFLDKEPKYILDHTIIEGFGILNIVLTMIVMGMFAVLYTYVVKRIEDTLIDSEKIQRQINFEKNKFISVFSHDLKDPVSALTGFSELLLTKYDRIDDTKKRLYLERINISAKEIINQIDNLVNWSKAQSGSIKVKPYQFKLELVINEMFDVFEEMAANKGIKLSKDLQPDIVLYADYEMIRTVLMHMVSNAIKFSKAGDEVIMKGKTTNKCIEVSVHDTGIGIPPEDMQRIFHIEHKMIRRGTDNETGTGLGLIICKEFVKMNDGTIFIESKENEGTVSTIRLPFKKE